MAEKPMIRKQLYIETAQDMMTTCLITRRRLSRNLPQNMA